MRCKLSFKNIHPVRILQINRIFFSIEQKNSRTQKDKPKYMARKRAKGQDKAAAFIDPSTAREM